MRNILARFLVIGALCLAVDSKADPPQTYTTGFRFDLSIGRTITSLSFPTPSNQRIVLPSAFSNWNCAITNLFRSPDGKKVYRNLACADTNSPLIIGFSVSCSFQSEDFDTSSVFLRTIDMGQLVDVGFVGSCLTSKTSAPNTGAEHPPSKI